MKWYLKSTWSSRAHRSLGSPSRDTSIWTSTGMNFFGCMFAERLPTPHVLAMQQAEHVWRSAAQRGCRRAAQSRCVGLARAVRPVLAKNSLPSCRAKSLGFGPHVQQPCQIRQDRSTSAACKSWLCQGNCASRTSHGYKHLPAWVSSCRHIPGKQSAEQPKDCGAQPCRSAYSV